ncbi:hypothetical protein [Mycoplasma simbae]|nr:hypothetical protein [Mycoplasma simbae]
MYKQYQKQLEKPNEINKLKSLVFDSSTDDIEDSLNFLPFFNYLLSNNY